MSDMFEDELKAEIESFRAEVREREERRERERRDRESDPSLMFDLSALDQGSIRELLLQRYDNARLRQRLEVVERRLAELEKRNG